MGGRLGEWLSDLSVLGISAATFALRAISAGVESRPFACRSQHNTHTRRHKS